MTGGVDEDWQRLVDALGSLGGVGVAVRPGNGYRSLTQGEGGPDDHHD